MHNSCTQQRGTYSSSHEKHLLYSVEKESPTCSKCQLAPSETAFYFKMQKYFKRQSYSVIFRSESPTLNGAESCQRSGSLAELRADPVCLSSAQPRSLKQHSAGSSHNKRKPSRSQAISPGSQQ